MKRISLRCLIALIWLGLLVSACNLPQSTIPAKDTGQVPTVTKGSRLTTAIPLAASPSPTVPPGNAGQAPSKDTEQATIGSDGGGDPYFPLLGNGGYDVLHYTLDLAVDMDADTIDGTATLEAKTTQALTRFDLDYAGPEVKAVTVDGQAADYRQDGSELVITPPGRLASGQNFTTAVSYSGAPGAGLPANTPSFSRGWIWYEQAGYQPKAGTVIPPKPGGVLVAAEPSGQEAWYPLNETPADKASYTFRITVDKPWVVAANGIEKSPPVDNGSTRTYLWQTDEPVAPYLVTLAIANFSEQTDTTSGVLVRNFFSEGYPDSAKQGFARLPQMITYFESLFGPYPFEAYGVVGHNIRLDFAMETQTLNVFGSSFTDEGVVSHELAHSWFGDSVTPYLWRDIWLNEGFASFAARMWQEHTLGKDSVSQALHKLYGDLVRNEGHDISIGDPGPDNIFSTQVYDRGELTLAALRARLGDDIFFKILQTYARRFYHANAATKDFIGVTEEVSGQNLDDFFQGWLYQTQMPDIPELGLFRTDFTSN